MLNCTHSRRKMSIRTELSNTQQASLSSAPLPNVGKAREEMFHLFRMTCVKLPGNVLKPYGLQQYKMPYLQKECGVKEGEVVLYFVNTQIDRFLCGSRRKCAISYISRECSLSGPPSSSPLDALLSTVHKTQHTSCFLPDSQLSYFLRFFDSSGLLSPDRSPHIHSPIQVYAPLSPERDKFIICFPHHCFR